MSARHRDQLHVPPLHVRLEQQSALVAQGPVPETQQTIPETSLWVEQTTLPARPVVAPQQSPFWKQGSRSSLQPQTPLRQTPVPHSAPKAQGAPLPLLSHAPPGQSPEQQLLAPDIGHVCPATWQQPQVTGLRT